MALTRFPIETTDPRIQVTLPVGRHVLELVVEDSAGLRSAPDQVIIEVRQEVVLPTITGISPVSGTPGSRVEAVISGTGLAGATAVKFANDGLGAAIGVGGTATSLPIVITIKADAVAGSYGFTVTTPSGTASSPSGVVFAVYKEPVLIQPRLITPKVVTPEISPITEVTPITEVKPVTEVTPITEVKLVTPITEVRPITEVTPITEIKAITPEVTPITEIKAITPEVKAITAEVKAVTPEIGTVVSEVKAITPAIVTTPALSTVVSETRIVTPVKKSGTKTTTAKPATRKTKK